MDLSSKQIGDWGEHWTAMRLLELGWNVKFLGDAVPAFDMIAHHMRVGARTVQVKTQRNNAGGIDLGPISTFSADFLVIVKGALSLDVCAYVYPKSDVIDAPLTRDATISGHPFARDPNPKKQDGLVHVWTHSRNHPSANRLNAWHLLGAIER